MLFLILNKVEISPYYDENYEIFTPIVYPSFINYEETYRDIYKGGGGLTYMENLFYICGTILSAISIYYLYNETYKSIY